MIVTFIRHGRTAWNEQRRMQGRADLPLTPGGKEQVLRWRLPGPLVPTLWIASPLARAVQTAVLLGARRPLLEAALAEMDWGEWEGCTMAQLRARSGCAFAAASARGIDFQPPGGESPREVQHRIDGWLRRLSGLPGPVVAITHKGVLRALLAQATGWDMIGKPPVRLADESAQVFRVAADGSAHPLAWNVPLVT